MVLFMYMISKEGGDTGSHMNLGASLSLGIKPEEQDSWDLWVGACGSFLWLLHGLGRAGLWMGGFLRFNFTVPVDDNSHKSPGVLWGGFSFQLLE